MVGFFALPAEIVIYVFLFLDNIDDVLHLARTCGHLNAIFEAHRLDIFTCVIQNGDHHKYDIQLHDREALYADFRGRFYDAKKLPELQDRPFFQVENLEINVNLVYAKLPAENVWSIVCRWHAMKTLFNLYCDDSIRTHYLQSMSPHVPLAFQEQFYEQWQLEQWETALVDEIPIPTPSFRDSLSFSHLNLAERQAAYQRFYRALCSTWLLFDDLWSIRVSRHPSVLATKDAFDVFTQDRWVDNKISDLHEKIEVVEVLEFVWLFLVRKLFPNPDELTAYFLAAGHEFLPDAERSTSVAAKWIYGLQWLVIYLRPPHIIELFIDICNSGERAINMPDYLKSLGLSDELFGLPEGDTTHHYPPPSLELHSIEFHGINRLIDGDDKIILPYHMGWLHEWGIYFYGRWASDLRGKPIFFPQPTDKLIRHIKED